MALPCAHFARFDLLCILLRKHGFSLQSTLVLPMCFYQPSKLVIAVLKGSDRLFFHFRLVFSIPVLQDVPLHWSYVLHVFTSHFRYVPRLGINVCKLLDCLSNFFYKGILYFPVDFRVFNDLMGLLKLPKIIFSSCILPLSQKEAFYLCVYDGIARLGCNMTLGLLHHIVWVLDYNNRACCLAHCTEALRILGYFGVNLATKEVNTCKHCKLNALCGHNSDFCPYGKTHEQKIWPCRRLIVRIHVHT